MTIQNQSSMSVRSWQNDLYANVGGEVNSKIQFHCTTKGELQPWRKSKKENSLRRGGKLPPVIRFIRFKSGIDRVTFELDA